MQFGIGTMGKNKQDHLKYLNSLKYVSLYDIYRKFILFLTVLKLWTLPSSQKSSRPPHTGITDLCLTWLTWYKLKIKPFN